MKTTRKVRSEWMLRLAVLLAGCLAVLAGCSAPASQKPFEISDISMDELSQKMDEGESFTLLVERDSCNFCQSMNVYLEKTKDEHPGIQVYRLNTTDYELYRENEGDMTLVSSTPEGQAFLARFPFFLYTPAIYKIQDGRPVEAGIGYDEARQSVSVWNTDSTIDWTAARPVDLWDFLAEAPGSSLSTSSASSSAA